MPSVRSVFQRWLVDHLLKRPPLDRQIARRGDADANRAGLGQAPMMPRRPNVVQQAGRDLSPHPKRREVDLRLFVAEELAHDDGSGGREEEAAAEVAGCDENVGQVGKRAQVGEAVE